MRTRGHGRLSRADARALPGFTPSTPPHHAPEHALRGIRLPPLHSFGRATRVAAQGWGIRSGVVLNRGRDGEEVRRADVAAAGGPLRVTTARIPRAPTTGVQWFTNGRRGGRGWDRDCLRFHDRLCEQAMVRACLGQTRPTARPAHTHPAVPAARDTCVLTVRRAARGGRRQQGRPTRAREHAPTRTRRPPHPFRRPRRTRASLWTVCRLVAEPGRRRPIPALSQGHGTRGRAGQSKSGARPPPRTRAHQHPPALRRGSRGTPQCGHTRR